MSTLWTSIPLHFSAPELIGLGVGAFVFIALFNDIRERARYSRVLRQEWHDIDPQPAGGRHHHPPRVVRFDGPEAGYTLRKSRFKTPRRSS